MGLPVLFQETVSAASRLGLIADQGCLKFHGPQHRRTGPAPAQAQQKASATFRGGEAQLSQSGSLYFCQAPFEPENQRHLTACITSVGVSAAPSFLTGQHRGEAPGPSGVRASWSRIPTLLSPLSGRGRGLLISEPPCDRVSAWPSVGQVGGGNEGICRSWQY